MKKFRKRIEDKLAEDDIVSTSVSLGISIGMCFGIVFGAALDMIGLGISLGMCIGVAIGTVVGEKKKKEMSENGPKRRFSIDKREN